MGKNSEIATEIKKKAMIKALEASLGNISRAARLAGINASTHYRWLKEDDDYGNRAESIKDISYRNIKDNLLDKALRKIEKGDSGVLNKMLGIFFKNLPEEMKAVSKYNNVPLRAVMKFAPRPDDFYAKDPMTQQTVKKWMEDKEKQGKLGEIRQDLVKKYKEGTIGEGEEDERGEGE